MTAPAAAPTTTSLPSAPRRPLQAVRLWLWLPLSLVIAAILVFSLMLVVQYQQFEQDLQRFAQQSVHSELLESKRKIENLLRRHEDSALDQVLAELALNPEIRYAALTNDMGMVLAATDFSWRGEALRFLAPDFPEALFAQVQRDSRNTITPHLRQQQLWALAPITMGLHQGELRTQRQGLLLLSYDLRPRIALAWSLVRQRALAFSVLVLLAAGVMAALGRWLVMRPVKMLQESMQRIGRYDFSQPLQWRGKGEFRTLGTALQAMADQLQHSRHAWQESQARYRQLADAAFEAIIIHDGQTILDVNTAAEQLLLHPTGSLVGHSIFSIMPQQEQIRARERIKQHEESTWVVEFMDTQGQHIPCQLKVRERALSNGQIVRICAMRDLREQLAAEQQILQLSQFDPLTGLCNRQYLSQRVQNEIALVSQQSGRRAALITIGLNGFKNINDSLGMAVGDQVLRTAAQRLTQLQTQGQTLGRVHSDTFALLITDIPGTLEVASSHAQACTEALLESLAQPLQLQERLLHPHASAGIVMIPNDSQDAAELLREAETAMHQAKTEGHSRIHFFAHSLQEAASTRLMLRSELRHALNHPPGGLLLHYQPQLNGQGQLIGVEALVRWQHPERGFMPPDAFISEAEASGLIVPLGQWVLEEAISCLLRWQNDPACAPWAKTLSMAVNVSPRQFREPDFVEQVRHALESSGVNPSCIELELTESVVADDIEATLQKMAQICDLGLCFALDDFGTGYSSLAYLKRLPIDVLKIDRSFVMDIDAAEQHEQETGKRPAVLIDAIVSMAHQLELQVLAEGVETEAQVQRLQQVGCDMFQGYFFSRPLPEAALRTWALERQPA